jgi:hypothetical protein
VPTFEPALSNPVDHHVNRSGATTELRSSAPRTAEGEPVTFTATVVAGTAGETGAPTPTGSVEFFVDGMPAGPAVTLDTDGIARLTTDQLRPGAHLVMVRYSGDERHDPQMTNNLPHEVTPDRAEVDGPSTGRYQVGDDVPRASDGSLPRTGSEPGRLLGLGGAFLLLGLAVLGGRGLWRRSTALPA